MVKPYLSIRLRKVHNQRGQALHCRNVGPPVYALTWDVQILIGGLCGRSVSGVKTPRHPLHNVRA
jgi:hypothetical protein